MPADGQSGEFIVKVILGAVALIVAGAMSHSKKAREAREALETQAQLQRVDEAIREARRRSTKSGGSAVVQDRAVSVEVRPHEASAYTVSSPSFLAPASASSSQAAPYALPVSEAAPPHARPAASAAVEVARGSENRQRTESDGSQVSEPSVSAESNSMPSRSRSKGLTGPVRLAAIAGGSPMVAGELRDAFVWREAFLPCPGLRR